ncbi:MAG: hypothetical protein WA441_05215 [Methyloceanibacter sp.]
MRIDVFDDDVEPLRVDILRRDRRSDQAPIFGLGIASMIIPLPSTSSAWAILPASPGTTIFLSKPKAVQSQSIAHASR